MSSFLKLSIIVLTFRLIVIKSDFCSDYAEEVRDVNTTKSTPNLKFIPTKDVLYLYLKRGNNKLGNEYVYEFDVSCNGDKKCPQIGDKQEISKVFGRDVYAFKIAYIQNGFTYLFVRETVSAIVFKYINTEKVEEYPIQQFWNRTDISYSVCYEWVGSDRFVKSRFMPPKTGNEDSLKYGFSYDNYLNKTIELRANYEIINIVSGMSNPILYNFGDYLVPFEYISYLPLPNGDAIINMNNSAIYTRNDIMSLIAFRDLDFYELLGCKDQFSAIPPKKLNDYLSDNIYPSYFTKNKDQRNN